MRGKFLFPLKGFQLPGGLFPGLLDLDLTQKIPEEYCLS